MPGLSQTPGILNDGPRRGRFIERMRQGRYYGISFLLAAAGVAPAGDDQIPIPWVERMPRLPEPLEVRDWRQVARDYYEFVLDPVVRVDGHPLVAVEPGKPGFRMPSFVGPKLGDEIFTCLSAVAGARLAGLDPRTLHGVDWVSAAKAWYDPRLGIYRHTPGTRGSVVHSGIYGYWGAALGLLLAGQYPDDPDFARHARTTAEAFLKVARGMGCPGAPDFDAPGFNFDTGKPEGRNEPMNRLGHAPTVAWILLAGHALTGDRAMLHAARSAMQWYADHPGRYEITHVMGPLTAARLNAEHGFAIDPGRVLAAWFGDGDRARHPWHVTAGTRFGGVTCDGLDGAKWDEQERSFHAFAMGTLQGPAWLVPVARYDPRYARAIARYALHAAASARLLPGYGLDGDHQDHKDWKDRWDPKGLLFYEALTPWEWSDTRRFRPYATGDPLRLGWGCPKIGSREYLAKKQEWFSKASNNLSLYMGNHVGFLGGIVSLTEVPGILRWDCVATDGFHPPAYPTFLYWNPHGEEKTVTVAPEDSARPYDLVARAFVARDAHRLTLRPDQAAVLVHVPADAKVERKEGRLIAGGVVVAWNGD